MANYVCVGYGVTDSDGVAHLTHDCEGNELTDEGYKGTGIGAVDFIASTDNPLSISDGSLQSETYDIIDAIYYSLNDWTLYKNSAVSVSSGANSVTITSPSANGLIYAAADTSYYTGNIYFKFKVVSFTGTIGLRYDSTSTRNADFSTDLSVQTNDTVKVYDDGSYVKILVNDVEKVSVAHSSQIRFGLRIEAGSSVELTDIQVYPI